MTKYKWIVYYGMGQSKSFLDQKEVMEYSRKKGTGAIVEYYNSQYKFTRYVNNNGKLHKV